MASLAAASPQLPPAVRPKPRWMQAVGGALIALLLLLGGWYVRSPFRTTGGSTPVQSIAVMSFRTSADDQRASALAQDLPEDLSAAIARTGLNVASRSSVLQLSAADPRSAGAQLGVDAVLEGSVRSYGSKFKVHVELVSTRTGFQIWSETFTAEGEDCWEASKRWLPKSPPGCANPSPPQSRGALRAPAGGRSLAPSARWPRKMLE